VTCEEARGLLAPYADGELDLVRGLEVERHLEGCPGCMAALEGTRSLSRALADPALYYQATPDLQRRVRASVRRAAGLGDRPAWRPIVAAAAAVVLVAAALWLVVGSRPAPPPADELLAREVVSSHVRSLMLDRHRVDVESSDRHTVKPWFLGKVDVAPEVKDLSAEGFPLLGGRLDYLDGRPAAALVYARRKHIINVFVFRADGKDRPPEALERQGYHLVRWADNGRTVWVVSDLNATELRDFAELLRR
jgi:anti-sigma factor RsiW